MKRPARWITFAAAAVLLVQTGLLTFAATQDSPTIDERGHLVAGIYHWRFGRFDIYRVNPPLMRLLVAAPAAAAGVDVNWRQFDLRPGRRPEFALGEQLLNDSPAHYWPVVAGRLALLPVVLLGGWVVFRWARELYGPASGLVALMIWSFSPYILGHGHLMTPDAGAAALAVAAAYCFLRWVRTPTVKQALIVGAILGAAQLYKMTLLVLYPTFLLLWMLAMRRQTQSGAPHRPGRDLLQMGLMFVLSVYVLNAGYGFTGTFERLGSHDFVSELFTGRPLPDSPPLKAGNRFRGTWIENWRVPLPTDYLLGIDVQRKDFESNWWSYMNGHWKPGGWWYYYLYSVALKVPLGTWLLLFLAVFLTATRRVNSPGWHDEVAVLLPGIVIFAFVSSQSGFSHHSRYILPALPFLFIWASKAAQTLENRTWVFGSIACAATGWMVVSSMSVYPHSLAYFNELAGGPKHGYLYLDNSNIDWGQDIWRLEKWAEANPQARPLGADVFGVMFREHLAERYQSVPIGTETRNEHDNATGPRGPQPGWYALSVNRLIDRRGWYDYFSQFEPVERIGYSILVFHITQDDIDRAADRNWE